MVQAGCRGARSVTEEAAYPSRVVSRRRLGFARGSAHTIDGLGNLMAGGTQAGKTTMLNCLAAAVPGRERVISVEEVYELLIRRPVQPFA